MKCFHLSYSIGATDKNVIATAFLLYIMSLHSPHPSFAESTEKGCFHAAQQWIMTIRSGDVEILRQHGSAICQSSRAWLEKYGSGSSRQRLCQDLILIRTHKECIYFRDYITEAAYRPCKVWSREMYERCITHDDSWFEN